jgi:hypothetical protein
LRGIRVGEISELGGDAAFEESQQEIARRRGADNKIEKAAARAVLKRLKLEKAATEIVNDTEHEVEWRVLLGDEQYDRMVDAFGG